VETLDGRLNGTAKVQLPHTFRCRAKP
jgi:hypothetical protein